MSIEKLDCRGLACPNPVLKTKQLIDRGDVSQLTVQVDNPAAKENVSRFLKRFGYQVQVSEQKGIFTVEGSRSAEAACEVFVDEPSGEASEQKIAVLVGTDRMGSGDDELGRKLIINFVSTLKEMGPELWRLIFLNAGVKLTIQQSPVLPTLRELQEAGIQILVCGTCLEHFGLLEQKLVGETTNMLDIVTALQLADKTITLT